MPAKCFAARGRAPGRGTPGCQGAGRSRRPITAESPARGSVRVPAGRRAVAGGRGWPVGTSGAGAADGRRRAGAGGRDEAGWHLGCRARRREACPIWWQIAAFFRLPAQVWGAGCAAPAHLLWVLRRDDAISGGRWRLAGLQARRLAGPGVPGPRQSCFPGAAECRYGFRPRLLLRGQKGGAGQGGPVCGRCARHVRLMCCRLAVAGGKVAVTLPAKPDRTKAVIGPPGWPMWCLHRLAAPSACAVWPRRKVWLRVQAFPCAAFAPFAHWGRRACRARALPSKRAAGGARGQSRNIAGRKT